MWINSIQWRSETSTRGGLVLFKNILMVNSKHFRYLSNKFVTSLLIGGLREEIFGRKSLTKTKCVYKSFYCTVSGGNWGGNSFLICLVCIKIHELWLHSHKSTIRSARKWQCGWLVIIINLTSITKQKMILYLSNQHNVCVGLRPCVF